MTNITEDHRRAFKALTSGQYDDFCLFSCYANGERPCATCGCLAARCGRFR